MNKKMQKEILAAALDVAIEEYRIHKGRFDAYMNSVETYHLGVMRFNDPEWTMLYTLSLQAEMRVQAVGKVYDKLR